MRPRRGVVIAALCATAVLSVCGARLAGFGLPAMENSSRPPAEDPATSVSAEPFASAQVTAAREDAAANSDMAADPAPVEPAFVPAFLPAAGVETVEDASPVAPLVQITPSPPVQTENEGVSAVEIFDECLVP